MEFCKKIFLNISGAPGWVDTAPGPNGTTIYVRQLCPGKSQWRPPASRLANIEEMMTNLPTQECIDQVFNSKKFYAGLINGETQESGITNSICGGTRAIIKIS